MVRLTCVPVDVGECMNLPRTWLLFVVNQGCGLETHCYCLVTKHVEACILL